MTDLETGQRISIQMAESYRKESRTPVSDQEPTPYERNDVGVYDPIEDNVYAEPGHWADVADYRLPLLMEDGQILLESDMRGVPTEGVQGTYTTADPDEHCPTCDLPGVHTITHTMAGVHYKKCAHCPYHEEL